MVARLVKSLAGHDKESLYFVMREDADYVYLVDGALKLVENPKKKNKKHVQPIVKMKSDELEKKLMQHMPIRNEEIKRFIKLYQKGI